MAHDVAPHAEPQGPAPVEPASSAVVPLQAHAVRAVLSTFVPATWFSLQQLLQSPEPVFAAQTASPDTVGPPSPELAASLPESLADVVSTGDELVLLHAARTATSASDEEKPTRTADLRMRGNVSSARPRAVYVRAADARSATQVP